jgi:thiamine-phosphate pyrophosphorylase
MKIIVISSNRRDEKEVQLVNKLFENGMQTFHLRKPKFTTEELGDYIKAIPEQFHKKIVIHSHHNLAGKFKLKGIHFTKNHIRKKNKTWLRLKLLSWKRPISSLTLSSSHSKLSTIYDAEPYNYDYVFLSPIFDSLTGKFQSGFHEEGIKAAIQKSGKKIIARGGVDYTRVEKINALGFTGLALYSALWEKPDPLAEYLKVMSACSELGIKTD